MFDLIEISKNEFNTYNVFENTDVSFKYSIDSNPKIKPEIRKIYERTLKNKAKFMLDTFHLNIVWVAEEIIKDNQNASELVDSLVSYISAFFDELEFKLKIRTLYELERINFILQLTSVTIQNALDYRDIELVFESFYQVENRLEIENLFIRQEKKSFKINNVNYNYKTIKL